MPPPTGSWMRGVTGTVDPWAFSYRVIRPLGAALADGMFGDYDALPEAATTNQRGGTRALASATLDPLRDENRPS